MYRDVTLFDKTFSIYKKEEEILAAIKNIATAINRDYADKNPILIPILNGSFMFAADLMKEITIPCEISFVKVASYNGTNSTGEINDLIGINSDISGKEIIILEDIVAVSYTHLDVYKRQLLYRVHRQMP